jgi:hypothetical protein
MTFVKAGSLLEPLNVKSQINHLVASSENVEDVESIFERDKDGGYIFRMNIAVDAIKIAEKIQQPNSTHSLSSIDLSVGQDFIKIERRISSYLNSASGIAKIRSQIEDSDMDDLKNLLKIKYKDKYIGWKDFYYEDARYYELFDKTIKVKEIEYPIAIVVTVKDELRTSETATKFPWSFNCHSEEKDSLSYVPTIYIANKKLTSSLERNKSYLVVSKVWTKKPPYSNRYRNINISVFFKSQIRAE